MDRFTFRFMPYFVAAVYVVLLAVPIQSSRAQEVVGFRLGLNVARLSGDLDATDEFDTRSGFAAGLFGTVPLRYGLAIQPELLYSQKGFSTATASIDDPDNPGGFDPLSARVELTYLEVPVLLKYGFETSRSSSLSAYAGPTVSFELSERIVVEGLDGSQSSSQFRTPEIGVAAGVDFETAVLGPVGLVGVRFTRGVGNVREDTSDGVQGRSVHNQVLSFFVGLHLR